MSTSKTVSAKQSIHYRNYRRARDRALVRLSHAYPDTYKQLLELEKDFDEKEGKKWVSIGNSTSITVGVSRGRVGAVAKVLSQSTVENTSDNAGKV